MDDTVSASIVAQLLFLDAENPEKPINLYINSPGGSVTAGLAIYDCMTYIQSEGAHSPFHHNPLPTPDSTRASS